MESYLRWLVPDSAIVLLIINIIIINTRVHIKIKYIPQILVYVQSSRLDVVGEQRTACVINHKTKWNIAGMGEMKYSYQILTNKLEGKRHF